MKTRPGLPGLPKRRHPCRNIGTFLMAAFLTLLESHIMITGLFVHRPPQGGYMCDTVLSFDCPYCSAPAAFQPMVAYKDGRFVCWKCGHTLRPEEPIYECLCRNCQKAEIDRRSAITTVP